MAWTQTDLDTLDAAYARGIRRVTFVDGQTVEFHSVADYQSLRRDMLAEIAAAAGTRKSFRLAASSKGV
jgi:hypothetical protein